MDLVQLKYFVKIVEHESFTKAAHDCDVSQPALSQQIRKLESELGQQLIERNGRNIRILNPGRLLYDRAIRILQLVDDARRQITDDGQNGTVSISAIPTIGPYLLPKLLKALAGEFSSARFLLAEAPTRELLKSCVGGETNLGLIAMPVEERSLAIEPLFCEELLLAIPQGHPLCKSKQIFLDALQDEPFILLDEAHCLVQNIESFCSQQRFYPLVASRIHQLVTVQNLVALGLGLSFIPKMACGEDCGGKLVYRALSGPKPTRMIAACFNPLRYQSQLLQNVIKAIRELLSTEDFSAVSRQTHRARHYAQKPS